MNNILIINLKKDGDVLSCGHLINSIRNDKPHTNIHLLILKKHSNAAKTLSNITKIFELNVEDISLYKTNRLFSDAFALNEFTKQIKEVNECKWDEIINYSNDPVSTNLTSYFKKQRFKGIQISKFGSVEISNPWSLLLNEVLPFTKESPLHLSDCFHNILRINHNYFTPSINSKTFHDHNAQTNFAKLRKALDGSMPNTKLIGIKLQASQKILNLPHEQIIKLVSCLLEDEKYYPLIITSTDVVEKELAKNINERFDNTLIIIETDLIAFPSVLFNIDLLISPDSPYKHLADLTDTPMIEVNYNISNTFRTGSVLESNLVLRLFDSHNDDGNELASLGHDIYECIRFYYSETNNLKIASACTLYQVASDENGINYIPISGSFSPNKELRRIFGKVYIYKLIENKNTFKNISPLIKRLEYNEINAWITFEKQTLTEILKYLLATLKSVRELHSRNSNSSSFIKSLDKLLEKRELDSMVAIPLLLFKGKVESISTSSVQENIKEIERLLFNLKEELQTLNILLTEFDSFSYRSKKIDTRESRQSI